MARPSLLHAAHLAGALAAMSLCLALAPPASACIAMTSAEEEGGGRGVRFQAGQYVLVAPFNLTIPLAKELHGKTGPVGDALVHYLESRGVHVDVLPAAYARGIWEERLRELSVRGQVPTLQDVCGALARSLAERERFDYIVIPTVVQRLAKIADERASWDGVRRSLVVKNFRYTDRRIAGDVIKSQGGVPAEIYAGGLEGRAGAASIHVAVLDAKGRLVYDGIGGLALLHEARGTDKEASTSVDVELVLREAPFRARREVTEGLRIAFEKQRAPSTPRDRSLFRR